MWSIWLGAGEDTQQEHRGSEGPQDRLWARDWGVPQVKVSGSEGLLPKEAM